MHEFPKANYELTWRPFQLNPDMPLEGMDREKYLELKFNGKENVKNFYNEINTEGLNNNVYFQFNKILKTPNSFASHKLLAEAYKFNKQTEVVETLFYDYFIEGIDIGNIKELVRIAKQHNIYQKTTSEYLESTQDNSNLWQKKSMRVR